MDLFRVHAFSVDPVRTLDGGNTPEGGRIDITSSLRSALQRNFMAAKFNKRARVDFDVDPETRTNNIRDQIMNYAFGNSRSADASATQLSILLSEAMDLRSKPNLFIITSLRSDDLRRVVLWIFPRDTAFRLITGEENPTLQELTDIFSQTSRLRKAASFEGRNIRTNFLHGRILDFQSGYEALDIADFWIERFLQCRFSISGEAGSRLLADAFKEAADASITMEEKEQLIAAIMAIRNSPRSRWSIREIADSFLEGNPRDVFLESTPNVETRSSTFEIDRDVFNSVLKFRIFSLDTGVFVSSPLEEVGNSVSLEGDEEKTLECRGTVLDQKVRTRHA
jgi:hypothetical protein